MMHYVLALAAATAWSGCSQPSATIDTDRITASVVVTASGGVATRVRASLAVNGVQDLILTDDDTLYAEVGNRRVEMPMVDLGDHEVSLIDVPALSTVTVDLDRAGDDSAPDSHVTIPAVFEVDPLAPSYARSDMIRLQWSPTLPAGAMAVLISGDCIIEQSRVVVDSGTLDIPGLASQSIPGESCEVTATVTRGAGGTIDPALDAFSGIRAEQVRSVAFVSTP